MLAPANSPLRSKRRARPMPSSQPLFRSNLAVEIKADRSPVTEADIRAEAAIRAVLSRHFPALRILWRGVRPARHAVGERVAGGSAGRHQVLRARYPLLLHADRIDATGAIWCWAFRRPAPAGELAWAEAGGGAWLNGQRIRVSDKSTLGDAILSTGNLKTLAASPQWAELRQAGARRESAARLRGLRALPPAGARRAGCGDRVGREHPRCRRAGGDRARGGRHVHRPGRTAS